MENGIIIWKKSDKSKQTKVRQKILRNLERNQTSEYHKLFNSNNYKQQENLLIMQKAKELLTTIKTAKIEYLGHIMRNSERYGLQQLILQGKVEGKRRISWLKNLRTWFNTTTTNLSRAALCKVQIAIMVANIPKDRHYKKKKKKIDNDNSVGPILRNKSASDPTDHA
uniref:Uncharacterized protein LOC114325553 n=1 Tax=Diabrotica virgifera virgifera TaxID=50390 RepID=A0A6P7F260_DIAVI